MRMSISTWPFGNVASSLALVLLFSAGYRTLRNSGQMNKYLFLYAIFDVLAKHRSSIYIYVWENIKIAALFLCLLESLQPHLSLNVSSFGIRHWQLKLGLVISWLLMGDTWQIFDSCCLSGWHILCRCTFSKAPNSSLALCKLSGLFEGFLYFIPFVTWSIPFLIN